MVGNITSLTGNGLRDWLIQRISAVILGLYVIFLVGFGIFNPDLQYDSWHSLFVNSGMRVASVLVLLALLAHAWIGIWTVITDYIKTTAWRLTVQLIVIVLLLACFIWGLEILWRH